MDINNPALVRLEGLGGLRHLEELAMETLHGSFRVIRNEAVPSCEANRIFDQVTLDAPSE